MKTLRPNVGFVLALGLAGAVRGHDLGMGLAHPTVDASVTASPAFIAPAWFVGAIAAPVPAADSPAQAEIFRAFATRVAVRWDDQFLFVESGGLPAHGMMVGITAWQQQVPLPQSYRGENAWRIPLHPVPAKLSRTIRDHFLRGAIAIAADGIPIFNPQNNRGEISQAIGELDQWGGHCGRADDYHYHVMPLFLQQKIGPGKPIAYALDGYPIYGLTEPDGSPAGSLDENHGHSTPGLGYHYHASTQYPYVIGGFHGEVVEREGQVDPQPRARPLRPALRPLRGAQITAFTASADEKSFALQYTVNGSKAEVRYANEGANTWKFQFVASDGTERTATYGAPDGPPPPPGDEATPGEHPRRRREESSPSPPAVELVPPRSGAMLLRSPAVLSGGELPKDFTGDGTSATLPLDWSGAPAGTAAYALIMHHLDPQGIVKWYWVVYNIPADVHSLPRNMRGVGILGTNSINDEIGYAPPHSQGPGPKTYVLTLYALSAPVRIKQDPSEVSRAVLLRAMKDLILDSAELRVVYTRPNAPGGPRQGRRKGEPAPSAAPP